MRQITGNPGCCAISRQDREHPTVPTHRRLTRSAAESRPRGALYTPDPSYSDAAREARYQASALLWLVVGTDGLPAEIRIQRPAGMGLDEQAIGVVQNWRFEPAKKDGEPVPVQIWVEVSFKLF